MFSSATKVSAAYQGRLNQFDRHVLMIRPHGVLVVTAEKMVAAARPARMKPSNTPSRTVQSRARSRGGGSDRDTQHDRHQPPQDVIPLRNESDERHFVAHYSGILPIRAWRTGTFRGRRDITLLTAHVKTDEQLMIEIRGGSAGPSSALRALS
jgi:hypothetical protein